MELLNIDFDKSLLIFWKYNWDYSALSANYFTEQN